MIVEKVFCFKIYLVVIFLFLSCMVNGQMTQSTLIIGRDISKEVEINGLKWSIGPSLAVKSIKTLLIYDVSLQLSRSLSTGQRIRVEGGYRVAGSNLEQKWGGRPMNMKTDIGSVLFGASYDWFPFVTSGSDGKFLKSVKVYGGMLYLNKPDYAFEVSLRDPLVIGSFTFSIEEVGTVFTTIKTNKLQPYLGVGYDQFYLGKKINFSLNGGMIYQGKPQVDMVATKMLEPTSESGARFQHNLESYQFVPVIQLLIQFNIF